jgi:hypothetical protein
MEYINLLINNARQVFPILHDPGDFLPFTSLLSPVAQIVMRSPTIVFSAESRRCLIA